jgi:cytochrome c peroxidase
MRPVSVLVALAACSTSTPPTKDALGRMMFEDPGLSNPAGQACADCHAAKAAFRDPESDHAQSAGVVPGRFGSRNSPSILYARYIPPLHQDAQLGSVGGLFWDGRAATLEAQIGGPLLNPLEMNNPDKASVVDKVRSAKYASAVRDIYGADVFDDPDRAYDAITNALATFERSAELGPFNSRYDHYLAGTATLGDAELRGLAIFEDPARGDCARCHPNRPAPDGTPPLFTTFAYANLGIPRYQNNKFYEQPAPFNKDGAKYLDRGLAATTNTAADEGKFRIPTLRDVARTGPYGHNGYFANLPYALEFIANRDAGSFDVGTCSRTGPQRCAWPEPEVVATVDHSVGTHVLPPQDLDDLAAFLATLNDEPK